MDYCAGMKQEILYFLMAMISKLYCQMEKVNICTNGYVFMYVCSQSVQSFSHVWLFATLWTAAHQASLSITNSRSLLKFMAIELVMPSNHLTLCCPFLFPPSIFLSIRVFSNESVLCIRWPKYWSFGFSISPSNEYSGLLSFRIDWFDLLTVQGTLKSLLQHHSSKANRIREVGWGQLTNDLVCYAKVFLSQKISRPTDIENKLVVASGDREWMGSNIGLGE